MDVHEKCPEIAGTALWEALEEKAGEDHEFLTAVGEICCLGVTLSKDVIRFFPTFTLHDSAHITGVCKWMARLLGDRRKDLTAQEAALLLMSACCHDIGMSVSADQWAELAEELSEAANTGDCFGDWLAYFKKYPGDEVAYRETGTLSEQMLRRYVREYHARRVEEQLPANWPRALTDRGIFRDRLVRLCQSHGEDLTESLNTGNSDFDLNLCAALLRLADMLDYDAGRAPETLFLHLGLDHPDTPEQEQSRTEWKKNAAGGFREIREGGIVYRAAFDSPQTEHEVREYLYWVRHELTACRDFLSRFAGNWQNLALPYRVTEDVTRNGYEAEGLNLTMDQDRILELLTGRNLYDNPGVFVRELLQNAIDAVLARRRLDPLFEEDAGRVVVRTWTDDEGYAWFRMEDDGIGMDQHIIHDYFLRVGRSYYTSEEYQAAELHAARDTGFKPTSRFGIGILSCFMSDPDRTVVEVSTRRFSPDRERPNPAYRLNVTGLHGYYYLTEAKRGQPGQPMHRPPKAYGPDLTEAKDSYRRGVGTTVCVRTNLYRLGGVETFKELLDKYVMFPEVPVDYYGPEVSGRYTYPTQMELMDAVHKLNEGMVGFEPVPHVHPFTDKMMKELEAQLPPVEWKERPALVLRYYPLDWLSGSGNLSGTAITVEVRGSAACRNALEYGGEMYQAEYSFRLEQEDEGDKLKINCKAKMPKNIDELIETISRKRYEPDRFYSENTYQYRIIREFPVAEEIYDDDYIDYISIRIAREYHIGKQQVRSFFQEWMDDLDALEKCERMRERSISCNILSMMDSMEKSMFQFNFTTLNRVAKKGVNKKNYTAYNGVLADIGEEMSMYSVIYCWNLLILLQGCGCPDVNLSRNSITSLPLEAACDVALVCHFLPDNATPHYARNTAFALLPEQYYRDVLDRHPKWEDLLRYKVYSLSELEDRIKANDRETIPFQYFNRELLYDLLCLAALKRRFRVCDKFGNYSNLFLLAGHSDSPVGFPVSLFFHPENDNVTLGRTTRSINYYNIDHRFSRWLIAYQKQLQEKVPGIYDGLMQTMVLGLNKNKVQIEINDALSRLERFPGNPFDVTPELYIQDGELK